MQTQKKIINIQSNNWTYADYNRGNTAPATRPIPGDETRESEIERRRRERRNRFERNARIRAIERGIRMRYERINRFSRGELIAVGVTVALMAVACGYWLYGESEVSASVQKIGTLRTTYSELVHSNKLLENNINSEIDPEKIYDRAVNEFGMRYPEKYQVIYYEKAEEGYVYQKDSIPGEAVGD